MSFCCLPKLSCLKGKSRIRSHSENSKLSSKIIEKSFSYDRLSQVKVSKNISMSVNRSLPDINKNLNISKGSSYRSTIAVRCADKFEILNPNLTLKKEKAPSLDVSKISNMSYSDHSCAGIIKEMVFPEKNLEKITEKETGRSGRSGRTKRNNMKALQFIKNKKKEAPPMFLQNPCFGSWNNSLQKIDSDN